mmetsp:Transcript_4454/g.9121  ORF Transcript_4454/g.9121 Transcript_4454/m.9121 type:complete len:252 (+) Transcript_4454:2091-2846(+)
MGGGPYWLEEKLCIIHFLCIALLSSSSILAFDLYSASSALSRWTTLPIRSLTSPCPLSTAPPFRFQFSVSCFTRSWACIFSRSFLSTSNSFSVSFSFPFTSSISTSISSFFTKMACLSSSNCVNCSLLASTLLFVAFKSSKRVCRACSTSFSSVSWRARDFSSASSHFSCALSRAFSTSSSLAWRVDSSPSILSSSSLLSCFAPASLSFNCTTILCRHSSRASISFSANSRLSAMPMPFSLFCFATLGATR